MPNNLYITKNINNYGHSIYITTTSNGILYVFLLTAICFNHGGHLQAAGTFIIALLQMYAYIASVPKQISQRRDNKCL